MARSFKERLGAWYHHPESVVRSFAGALGKLAIEFSFWTAVAMCVLVLASVLPTWWEVDIALESEELWTASVGLGSGLMTLTWCRSTSNPWD